MRRDSTVRVKLNTGCISGYHDSPDYTGTATSYTQAGYPGGQKVFVSDRAKTPEPGATYKTYGLEIETVAENITNEAAVSAILAGVVFPAFPAGLFKMERDGSLEGQWNDEAVGVEVISQPMTEAFIRNQYAAFKAWWTFGRATDILPNNSCGMHTNISLATFGDTDEERERAILNLHNFINGSDDAYLTACALFHRAPAHAGFARQMRPAACFDDLPRRNDHHASINYAHMDEGPETARVEIRLVGPQKLYPSFRNTMEVIFHLVKACRKLTALEMQDPVKVWKGCNLHVYDRLTSVYPSEVVSRIKHNDKCYELEGEHLYSSYRNR